MIEQVRTYLNNGFNVIPVNQDKTPACDWKYFQSNKMDNFDLFTTDCLAVICGKISDNLEVIDFDNHGGTAKENLKNFIENPLVKEIYDNYKLPIIQTQSNGYHLYYRCEVINGNQKLACVKLNGKMDTIIETRGEGGYVLAPPSLNYKLIRNKIEDLQYITENERTILHEVAKSFNQFTKPTQNYKPKVDNESPGNIYDSKPQSIIECRQLLLNAGWTDLGYNDAWCRPGKSKGVSATFGKVAPGVFYCFTSNSEHFENDKGYSPFAIKSILQYNGDFSACAKDLVKEYGLNNKPVLNVKIDDYEIDLNKPFTFPVFVIKMKVNGVWINIGSLKNFSCLTGAAKARKSFLRFFFEAAAIKNGWIENIFYVDLPEGKRDIVSIDTEQGEDDVLFAGKRILKMAGHENKPLNYKSYQLRALNYSERCVIIEEILSKNPNIGIMFIDGVADLASCNNDEIEGNRVAQLLMTWTFKYNCHIMTVIHQPRSHTGATGHLGSSIEKKSQAVIGATKDKDLTIVESKMLRMSKDFTPFPFAIDENYIPFIWDEEKPKPSLKNFYEKDDLEEIEEIPF